MIGLFHPACLNEARAMMALELSLALVWFAAPLGGEEWGYLEFGDYTVGEAVEGE